MNAMKPIIEYPDFEKLDIRIGKVVAGSEPDWSRKLLEFKVDFGKEIGEKTILSGVRQWYKPEFFVGKMFCFIINLAERKMGEGVSQGMMLMADDDAMPMPFPVAADVEPGTIVR